MGNGFLPHNTKEYNLDQEKSCFIFRQSPGVSKKLREEQLDFLSKIQKSKYSDIGDPEIHQE